VNSFDCRGRRSTALIWSGKITALTVLSPFAWHDTKRIEGREYYALLAKDVRHLGYSADRARTTVNIVLLQPSALIL
jgi:hypothetical protein